MTHPARILRRMLDAFTYPVPIFPEVGDTEVELVTRRRLLHYLNAGVVVGIGGKHIIRKLRFTVNERARMEILRLAKPNEVQRLPIAGEALRVYIDIRRKYRRTGLPRRSEPRIIFKLIAASVTKNAVH